MNITAFTRRQAPLQVQIVASRVADRFHYLVIVDERSTLDALAAHSLIDARGLAAFFSDTATEVGPAEAFHRRARV